MKKILLNILIIVLTIALLGCVNKNQNNDNDDVSLNGDTVQNSANEDIDTPLNNNISSILDYINKDTINLVKYLFDLDIGLEGMEKKYGSIMAVDWIDGAFYRHEKLDLWVAYFFEESFVVSFNEEDYIIEKLGEVETYRIDYTKGGPYTILEAAKNAPILRVKCQLSDLFDEPDSLSIEDFAPFAEIYESLEWTGKDIVFACDGLTITIWGGSDNALHGDCEVFIE